MQKDNENINIKSSHSELTQVASESQLILQTVVEQQALVIFR